MIYNKPRNLKRHYANEVVLEAEWYVLATCLQLNQKRILFECGESTNVIYSKIKITVDKVSP